MEKSTNLLTLVPDTSHQGNVPLLAEHPPSLDRVAGLTILPPPLRVWEIVEQQGLIAEIPSPPELPVLGDVFIIAWSRIFRAICRGEVHTVIVHRVSHYQGLVMAIKRHNVAAKSAARIGVALIYDGASGQPLHWAINRLADLPPAPRAKAGSTPKRARGTVTTTRNIRDQTVIGVLPWEWLENRYAELLRNGKCDLTPSLTGPDLLRRWLYARMYRAKLSLAVFNPAVHKLITTALNQAPTLRKGRKLVSEKGGRKQANTSDSWLQQERHFAIAPTDGLYRLTISDALANVLRQQEAALAEIRSPDAGDIRSSPI